MAYVTPIHHPSCVRTAIKLRLRDEEEECLAVVRFNRLELYVPVQVPTSDGVQTELELVNSTRIWGRITILHEFRPAGSLVDHIFIGTDSCRFFTMAWDKNEGRLKTIKTFEDLADQTLRESQTGERCHIDPTGRFLTLEVYEGVITTIPLFKQEKKRIEKGLLLDPITSRISDLFVKSSAFLARRSEAEDPQLAMLYGDLEDRPRLRLRNLVYGQGDPADIEFKETTRESGLSRQIVERAVNDDVDFGASHLIPLQEAPWGMLILGETSITYFNDETYEVMEPKPLPEATSWIDWDRIDNSRYILADEYCQLWLLYWFFDQSGKGDFKLDKLGETSRATSLVYLGNGLLFLGAHYGDSQLIQIVEKGLEIVQTIPNISPILDFTIMDMGNRSSEGPSNDFSTGQARIVTCSGAWNNGSIRSVRSGVGLIEQAIVPEVAFATRLFSISTFHENDHQSFLLVSFVDETRVFVFDQNGNVEERTEHLGLQFDCPTLFADSVGKDHIVQVTPNTVSILDIESGFRHAQWTTDSGGIITSVSATGETLALVVNGIDIVLLDTTNNLNIRKTTSFAPRQVSCIALSSLIPNLCLIGFWNDSDVTILDLNTLKRISEITLTEDGGVGPRSILVSQLFAGRNPTALFSMADGHVISFEIDPTSSKVSQRTITILGTKQPDLQELPRADGTSGVFVSSEHPSLIYADDGRLSFSAVDTQDVVNCVCSFNSPMYPDSIVLATPKEVKICLLHETRTTQVQPLQVGETVKRLAYSPSLKAFGINTIGRKIQDSVEYTESSFKLVDEVIFKELASVKLRQDEWVEAVIRTQLTDRHGEKAEYFIVGTSFNEFSDEEITDKFRGRIIVYEVTEDRQLRAVASQSVKTACQCLAMVGDDLVAALRKTIVVYSLVNREGASWYFKKQATERVSVVPMAITVDGKEIAVADIMKSVSILEYKRPGEDPENPEASLVEVARHYGTVWATSLTQLLPDVWIQGDAEGNIIFLKRNREGVTSDDKRRLQIIGEYALGELVNRMHSIDVGKPTTAVEPKAFLATREGSLYLFALIVPEMQNFLLNLQENLANRVESPGDIPFNSYRAFKSQVRKAAEPFRIVDGELVERYLDLPTEIQKASIEGIMLDNKQVSIEQTRFIIEGLRRLH